jgi:hypothetical protein
MKVRLMCLLVMFLLVPVCAFAVDVDGYWRDTNHDGVKDTYVKPHQRTVPNKSRTDNYDYPGNYNPNTGRTTPSSNSPQETYPSNPNPYEYKNPYGY